MDEEQAQILARIDRKLDQHGLTERGASMLAVGKPDLIRDFRRAKGIPRGDRVRKLAAVLGTTVDWLLSGGEEAEAEQRAEAARDLVLTEVRSAGAVGTQDVRRAFYGEKPLPDIPLVGTAMGGETGDIDADVEMTELHLGEVLEYLARPAALADDRDAYALTIIGDSMVPRFKPGERATVSPRSAVRIGDDVIVQLRGAEGEDERVRMVLIKELVRRNAGFVELRQHNPPLTFRIEARRVHSMHRVHSIHP